MDRLFIIAPLSSISRRTRLFKLVKFLFGQKSQLEITHVGWERLPGEREEHRLTQVPIRKEIIIEGGGYGGRKARAMYILWMAKVFLRCLRLTHTDHVWALGFESAFPAILASKLKKFKVYFDDADRFSMIFSLPPLLRRIVEQLEAYTSRHSTYHIIPGTERYDFKSHSFYILKNMPSEQELDVAKGIYKSRDWPQAPVVININGWLGVGRGMDAALSVARAFPPSALSIILAGKLDCQAAEDLAKLPNTHYIGHVSNAEALASYYASDLVLTYYDPSIRINCLAESNKWGDAIKTGVGVIVNSEVETANYLREGGATISLPYNDHSSLIEHISELVQNQHRKLQIKANARNLSEKFGYFEEQLTDLFNREFI